MRKEAKMEPSMPTDTAIAIQNLTKVYRLYESPSLRLKEALNPFGKSYHKDFYALDSVSFEVKKGETVGIIGRNGTGKSTLLKVITGVITPTTGDVTVNGRISALLELGAGFNPQISGLENVYFNGTLIGFSKEEIDTKLPDILAFADIGDFIYQPVRTYSSGMFIRLAFAVAVHADPDILIVDEALSVGDAIFQAKCLDRIKGMMKKGVTTLFVTHSMETVNTLCNRAVMLDNGRVFADGTAQTVTLQYYQLLREQEHISQKKQEAKTEQQRRELEAKYQELRKEIQQKDDSNNYRYGTGGARITDFWILDENNNETAILRCGDTFKIRMKVEFLQYVQDPCFGFTISNTKGQNLLSVHTYHDGDVKFEPQNSGDTLEVDLQTTMQLNPGGYLLSMGVSDLRTLSDFTNLDARKNICKIEVYGKEFFHGITHHTPEISIVNDAQAKAATNELQRYFCEWNATRLGITIDESTDRFHKSAAVFRGGHGGKAYRHFCSQSHDVFSVFWSDSEREAIHAYKMHEHLHLLRMLSYPCPTWQENDLIVSALLLKEEVCILDYGCGMAQSSLALTEFLTGKGKKVKLVLADIPTIIKDFLLWVAAQKGFSVTSLDCTNDIPLPEVPPTDVIIATEVFEHIHNPVKTFLHLDGALVNGGFIITDVSDHDNEFLHVSPDLSQLRNEFKHLGYKEVKRNQIFQKCCDMSRMGSRNLNYNTPKVGWVLLGDKNTGSSRIHGTNIHNYLLANGISSTILQSNSPWTHCLTLSPLEQEQVLSSDINILIFQKVFDDSAIAFATEARSRGIKTVFLLSDRHETPMVEAVDKVIVTSDYLRSYLMNKGVNVTSIEDAVESPAELFKIHEDKKPLGLVWVGHSDNWKSTDVIRKALDSLQPGDFTLKTISDHPDADVPWKLESVFHEILKEDIAVIPVINNDWTQSKSNNRLTMFMALGIPVVASTIPAYVNIISNGINGFLARDENDWRKHLTELQSVSIRKAVAEQGKKDASRYNINTIGAQWIDLIHKIIS